METKVVVIGGGITGLSAAFRLKQRAEQHHLPIQCTVLEATHRFGGKIRTTRLDGFIMETGPDSLLARKPAGMQLIRDLGIESEIVNSNDAAMGTGVWHRGKLVPMPKGTNMGIPVSVGAVVKNTLVSAPGKLRALRDLILPANRYPTDVSVGEFLKSRFGDEWVDMMCEPLLAGIHAADLDELSLQATYPNFLQLARDNRSLILGSAKNRRHLKPARKTSGRSAFITLRDGLQTLVERLYDCLHDWAELETESLVEGIEKTADGKFTIRVKNREQVYEILADAVILTVPPAVAEKLLRKASNTAADQLAQIPSVSTATIIFGFEDSHLLQPLSGSGFLVPRPAHKLITACTYMSSKWPHTAHPGYSVIRCYVGRRGQEEGLELDDEALTKAVLEELQQVLPLTGTPAFHRVTRWTEAMPQYLVGHTERVSKAEQALGAQLPGLFLAGGAYHGVGIPDCIGQAQHAAEQTLAHLQKLQP